MGSAVVTFRIKMRSLLTLFLLLSLRPLMCGASLDPIVNDNVWERLDHSVEFRMKQDRWVQCRWADNHSRMMLLDQRGPSSFYCSFYQKEQEHGLALDLFADVTKKYLIIYAPNQDCDKKWDVMHIRFSHGVRKILLDAWFNRAGIKHYCGQNACLIQDAQPFLSSLSSLPCVNLDDSGAALGIKVGAVRLFQVVPDRDLYFGFPGGSIGFSGRKSPVFSSLGEFLVEKLLHFREINACFWPSLMRFTYQVVRKVDLQMPYGGAPLHMVCEDSKTQYNVVVMPASPPSISAKTFDILHIHLLQKEWGGASTLKKIGVGFVLMACLNPIGASCRVDILLQKLTSNALGMKSAGEPVLAGRGDTALDFIRKWEAVVREEEVGLVYHLGLRQDMVIESYLLNNKRLLSVQSKSLGCDLSFFIQGQGTLTCINDYMDARHVVMPFSMVGRDQVPPVNLTLSKNPVEFCAIKFSRYPLHPCVVLQYLIVCEDADQWSYNFLFWPSVQGEVNQFDNVLQVGLSRSALKNHVLWGGRVESAEREYLCFEVVPSVFIDIFYHENDTLQICCEAQGVDSDLCSFAIEAEGVRQMPK